jgi:hypothetical protein
MAEEKPASGDSESQPAARLSQDVAALSAFAERLRIREYVDLLQRPRRLLWLYFLSGLARGAGVAVGTFVVLGLLTYLLSTVVNVPMIGKYLAGIVQEIQRHLPSR